MKNTLVMSMMKAIKMTPRRPMYFKYNERSNEPMMYVTAGVLKKTPIQKV